MEDQINKYFSDYEELLKTKDFKMLSDSERNIVSLFSTEEEYCRMRKIILSEKGMTADEKKMINPDPESLNILLSKMRSKEGSIGAFRMVRRIIEYKIPAYQFALFAAASILLFFLIFNNVKPIVVQKPIYVYKTDTISKYIIKEIEHENRKPDNITNLKYDDKATIIKENVPENTLMASDDTSKIVSIKMLGIIDDLKNKIEDFQPKGRNMSDDSSMVKFFVKI